MPIYSRFAHWGSFACERTIAYCLDLICLRSDPVIFKTTAFIRRNFTRVRSTLGHIWLELKHVGHGFRKLKNDCFFVLGFHRKDYQTKYSTPMYFEKQKVKQVRTDVIKFIPFSFFILIPGAEILLPPFLMVFPNSVPSQFIAADARDKKFMEIKTRREKAATKLINVLPNYFYALEKDDFILPEDLNKIGKLKAALKEPYVLPTDLLQYKDIFRRYAEFKFFSVKELQKIAHFMSLEPVTGFNILNNVLKIFKLQIPLTAPIISVIS